MLIWRITAEHQDDDDTGCNKPSQPEKRPFFIKSRHKHSAELAMLYYAADRPDEDS